MPHATIMLNRGQSGTDVAERHEIWKLGELDDLVNVFASGIGMLTNPNKLENTFRSVLHSKISLNTIAGYIGYLEDAFVIEEARRPTSALIK